MAGIFEQKCATIAEISNGKNLKLNEEALSDILSNPKLEGKRLMIVSISGAHRKGKSFMLTLLKKYLQNEGQIYLNWLLRWDAIRDGFFWRGGIEPVTSGITMWKKPFFVKDSSEQEVAVLLMDTQGLFDHEANMDSQSSIFSFSTLLSSVQVYNISQQIQQYDLEYLKFFMEYAKAVEGRDGASKIPFQKLVCLVRDWVDPARHKFGHDGDGGYFSGILRKQANSKLENDLKSSFESVDCFLLPHPGNKVAETSKTYEFRGDLEDIDERFIKHCKRFALFLFEPTNLVPKKINGKEVTSRDLLNYAVCCAKQFEDEAVPKIVSMIEATAVTLCINISDSLLKKYNEEMEQMLLDLQQAGDYSSERDLKERHASKMQSLLEEYEKKARFGEEAILNKYSNALRKQLTERYDIYKRMNEANKTELEADMYCQVVSRLDEFTSRSPKGDDSGFEITSTVDAFSAGFRKHPNKDKYVKMLHKNLSELRDDQQKLKSEEKKQDVPGLNECLEEFRSLIKKITCKYLDDESLERKCSDYKEKILNNHAVEITGDKIADFRRIVGFALEEEIKCIIKRNSVKEGSVRLLFQNEIDNLQTAYLRVMDEGMRSMYVDPNVLVTAHEKMKKMLEKKLRSNDKIKERYDGTKLWEEYWKKLDGILDSEFKKQQKKNEENQNLFPQTQLSVSRFFTRAATVILAILGAPIAIAIGIPVAIFYGLYKGATELGKLIKKTMIKE